MENVSPERRWRPNTGKHSAKAFEAQGIPDALPECLPEDLVASIPEGLPESLPAGLPESIPEASLKASPRACRVLPGAYPTPSRGNRAFDVHARTCNI